MSPVSAMRRLLARVVSACTPKPPPKRQPSGLEVWLVENGMANKTDDWESGGWPGHKRKKDGGA